MVLLVKETTRELGLDPFGVEFESSFCAEYGCSFWGGPAVATQGPPKFPLPCATIRRSLSAIDPSPRVAASSLL
jgi:hypothetical protein